jgi:hypothetical protein
MGTGTHAHPKHCTPWPDSKWWYFDCSIMICVWFSCHGSLNEHVH